MTTIRLRQQTTAPPGRSAFALTDVGPRRSAVFGTGEIRERLHHGWSNPGPATVIAMMLRR
jgi:hypothetical protein